MRQILEALPQLPVIEQNDANRWIEGISRYHAPRASWHAKRLHGIGGSEMGAVVSFYRGEAPTGFISATEVVEGKLMKRLPQFETFHMRRGNALEDLARRVFLKSSSAVIDHAATKALRTARKVPGYEFMVGNQDDIVLINGKRFVVDYKVPNTFSESIEQDYEIQVHHYATQAKLAGVRVDGLILAKLDIPPQMADFLTREIGGFSSVKVDQLVDSIVNVNLPGCRIVPIPVELKRPLQAELLAAGKDIWNDFVLKGVVPTPKQRGSLELETKEAWDLARYQQQYAMAKSGITYLDKVAKESVAGMTSLLDGLDYEGKKLPLSLVGVNPNGLDSDKVLNEALLRGATEDQLRGEARVYSVDALLQEIQALGGDGDASHLYEQGFDTSKAQEYLKDLGVDLSTLRKPGIAVRMSIKKEDKEATRHYQDKAEERFGAWISESLISNQAEEEYQDVNPDEQHPMPIEPETGQLGEALADAFKAFEDKDEKHHHIPMRASPGLH